MSSAQTSPGPEGPVWLSIIVPIYNARAYLAEALDSMIAGLAACVEVIIVDDGSSDDSPAIIADYSRRYGFTQLVQANSGQGRARNAGIAAARGAYLYFFDSDDRLTPDFCNQVHARLAADDWPDVLLFGAARFHDADARHIVFLETYDRGVALHRAPQPSAVAQLIEHGGFFAQPCTYVSRKNLWLRHGLAFRREIYEDEVLFLKLMHHAATISVARQPWFERRIRPGSTMTADQTRRHTAARHSALRAAIGILGASARANTRYGQALRRYISTAAIVYIHSVQQIGGRLDWHLLTQALRHIRSPRLLLRVAAHLVPACRQILYFRRQCIQSRIKTG